MPGPVIDAIRTAVADARAPSLALAKTWREAGGWHALAARFDAITTVDDAVARARAFLADPACLSPLIDAFVAGLGGWGLGVGGWGLGVGGWGLA